MESNNWKTKAPTLNVARNVRETQTKLETPSKKTIIATNTDATKGHLLPRAAADDEKNMMLQDKAESKQMRNGKQQLKNESDYVDDAKNTSSPPLKVGPYRPHFDIAWTKPTTTGSSST